MNNSFFFLTHFQETLDVKPMEKGFAQMKLPPYLEIWGQVEDQKLALSSGDF